MAAHANDNQASPLEEALTRFVDECLQGSRPDIDEFAKQYPQCETKLKVRLQDLQQIDSLFETLTRADGIEFGTAATGCDLSGRTIGSFEIVEMIGRGGMGVVYLARDTRLDRSVAIKCIPAELAGDSTTRMRFTREARLLASLNHPNIAAIHEIIEEDDFGYLVLEYVPGQTLARRTAHKPLGLEEALSIGQQVAEAVSAAHGKGIVHRDLKPGNIKITPEGKVKVLDFGLAKACVDEDPGDEITITQPGRVMGTPAYMSPEQARGKPTDERSDIWSFGCIMYEMLTGRLPFGGETATDTVAQILERQPDWEALPQETPANVGVLLRRCLEKDPLRRLQHIGDAAIEIRETLNLPASVPPVTTPSSASLERKIAAKPRRRTIAKTIVAAAIVILCGIALQSLTKKHTASPPGEIRLVVLPFENLGSTDEYFADGITDAITARLAVIGGLNVISRQSAMQYKQTDKGARQIAKELSVDYILEGTIQRERPSDPNSRVRIIPQLINASQDTHVWTDIYDDDMSEVFRLQSDVAERVAQALDITLLEPERRALASRPTENMEAYDYYLRGEEYAKRSNLESDKTSAITMYKKAVELDPTFALAYARLSHAHRLIYWYYYDRSDERLAMAKQAVDKALELNPDLPEAHINLGKYYYHAHLDYDNALKQFEIAYESQPNSDDVLSGFAFVQRRQGKFEQAVANIERICELDPLNHFTAREFGTTLMYLRKYPEAEHYYDQAISLAPDLPFAYYYKAWLYLCSQGSNEKARAILDEAMQNIRSAEEPSLLKLQIVIDMFDGNYQKALDRLSSESEDVDNQEYIDDREYFIPNALLYARIYGLMNNKESAQANYESARTILESKIEQHPEHARFHSALGIAYAGLGRKEDAVRQGKLAVELLPVTKEAMRGPYRVEDLARIYVMVGKHNEAIDQLKYLLSIPGPFSTSLLQLDPTWTPLRTHPRYKELLEATD